MVISAQVNASVVSLNPTNAGWYTIDSNNTNGGPIHNTAAQGSAEGVEWRSFYVFAIPTLAPFEQIVSATLQWDFGGFSSPQGYETYALRSYEGVVDLLINGSGSFSDLGDGINYGEKTFSSSGANFMYLSASAVTDLNTLLGQQFAFGGILTTLQFDGIHTSESYVTNRGTDASAIRLVLNVSAIPIPASVWLFGTGLLGLIGIARRKKAA